MTPRLQSYRAKRDFASTAEPRGTDTKLRRKPAKLAFVIQKHAARNLHFDLRLELDGVMKSWAVPKGPSVDPGVKRLAMEVEDHPVEYNTFEGTIPKGQYGGGTVMLWDRGSYEPDEAEEGEDPRKAVRRGLRNGKLSFTLHGERLNGSFALVRTRAGERTQWLLIKHRDAHAREGTDIVSKVQTSVDSGRKMDEIASAESSVWNSNKLDDSLTDVLDAIENEGIQPMMPTESDKGINPGEGTWALERKQVGLRVLAFAASGIARIVPFGRNSGAGSEDANSADVQRALDSIARSRNSPLVLDGFLLSPLRGRAAKAGESGSQCAFVAVDILVDDHQLLIDEPYLERRQRLERALTEIPASARKKLRAVDTLIVDAGEVSEGLEHMQATEAVAKRIDSPYEPGRSEYWLVVADIGKRVVKSSHQPESIVPANSNDVVIDIDGRELSLSNLNKPFWPELGITKGDLLRYYEMVSPHLLPHLVNRAMVMKRYPHGASGEFFFMKRAPESRPDWIETCSITHASKSVIDFPMVQDLASLLWVVNLGCIDLNPWYSRCDDVDRPDFLHFDLDPVPNATFERVRETAIHLRELLDELALPSYAKTSGSKGIHVYVPIERGPLQKEVWAIAKAVAREMESRHPKLVTSEYRIAKRPKGRVLVDYNQNAWGRTLASVYSVRPQPDATVSAPVTWKEVETGVQITEFTLRSMRERLSQHGELWNPMAESSGRAKLGQLL